MDQSRITQKVKLTFASSFPRPVQAVFEGELVRVSHVGDAEGMSPVYNVTDKNGQSAWVPQSQVTIIDQDFVPISLEALESLTQSARGLASTGTGSLGSTGSTSRSSR